MKKLSILSFLCAGALLFSACDKVEDAATVTVNVPNFDLAFNAPIVAPETVAAKSSAYSTFSGEITVKNTDSYFTTVMKYKNKIQSINASTISVKITRLDGLTTGTVMNLLITASGMDETISVPSYTVGQVYSNPSVKTFVLKVINNILNNDEVTLAASGETDVVSGTFKCELLVYGMSVTAKTVTF